MDDENEDGIDLGSTDGFEVIIVHIQSGLSAKGDVWLTRVEEGRDHQSIAKFIAGQAQNTARTLLGSVDERDIMMRLVRDIQYVEDHA